MRLPAGPLCLALLATTLSTAHASGLDRDTILTDAAATPDTGAVRVSAAGGGTQSVDSSAQGMLSASVMWAPFEHFALDFGGYLQGATTNAGPAVRLRYQLLSQTESGIDLAGGVRYKSVGFDPSDSEVEMIVAAGRRMGRFEVTLDTVMGFETAGGGKDLELKGFGGYRISDALRAGIDSRVQFEVGDEEEAAATSVTAQGSDLDLTAGPAVSWMVTRGVQLQALAGIAKPKGAVRAGPTGLLSVSIDL